MGIGLIYPMFSSMIFSEQAPLLSKVTSGAEKGAILGVLLALCPLTSFFTSPLLGMFSDERGRRKVLLFILFVGVIGYLIAALGVLAGSIALLLLSRFVIGFAGGSMAVASAVVADISAPIEKAGNFGLYNMACGVGFAIGPFLGGKLSEIHFSVPFLFAGILTFINWFLVLVAFKETLHTRILKKVHWAAGFVNLKKALSQPNLRHLFAAAFFFAFGWSFYYEFIPVTWIQEFGFGPGQVGMMYAYASIFYAISSAWLIRFLTSRFHPQRIFSASLFIQALYIFLMFFLPNGDWLWGYLPAQQLLVALSFTTAQTIVSNAVNETMQGETLGILQSIYMASFSLSPLISGSLLGISIDMPIFIGALSMLVAGFALGFKRKS